MLVTIHFYDGKRTGLKRCLGTEPFFFGTEELAAVQSRNLHRNTRRERFESVWGSINQSSRRLKGKEKGKDFYLKKYKKKRKGGWLKEIIVLGEFLYFFYLKKYKKRGREGG